MPVIFGCSGPSLTADERDFFRDCQPAGFIIFGRNIEAPAQVAALVADLRAVLEAPHPAILIDQEGGPVQRLGPPHWPQYPPMAEFGDIYADSPADAARALGENLARITADLKSLGINVNCLPVLDVPVPGASPVIGERAFSVDLAVVADLGVTAVETLLRSGCAPVIKHIPGHGRAAADSHKELPVIDASFEALAARDFPPFAACAYAPLAMTAHVAFTALDGDCPASQSSIIVNDIIRGHIGFEGILVSDDIGMAALDGDMGRRAMAVLEAGNDLALHCSGALSEMEAVAKAAGTLDPDVAARLDKLLGNLDSLPLSEPASLEPGSPGDRK